MDAQRGTGRGRADYDGPGSYPSVDRLYAELGRKDLARHLAFFYRSADVQLPVAATFVRRGLEAGNRCLYFLDANARESVVAALEAIGIDVAARVEAGDLVIEQGTTAYREADFDPAELVARLEDACEESVADGYEGLWMAGETTWCFHTDLSYDHVVDFEADFDAVCPDLPVTALCQYDMERFGENSVAKALWTHEQVIYRNTLCENPFYIPPAEYRSAADRPLNTRLMLEQAYSLARAKGQVERREQRLTVVNRILRHNIRNDLNVTREILDLIRESECVGEDSEELLVTAMDHVDDVADKADKARYVQRTIDESTVRRTTLAPFLERARDRVAAVYPEADVTVAGDADVPVVADTNLDVALAELCLYAIRNGDADPPAVTVVVSEAPASSVHIEVAYPGPPVPREDREVLDQGSETQLEHGNGLELWLVKWIAENAYGRLAFPEDGDVQARIELGTGLH